MQPTRTPVSSAKRLLLWLALLGFTTFWIVLLLWGHEGKGVSDEPAAGALHKIVTLVFAGFALVAAVGGYLILLATDCFTFNFNRPVWGDVKGKLYVANLVVLTAAALGLGLALNPFVGPGLARFGVSGELTFLIPVMTAVVMLQIVPVFVLIWTPLEKRLILKRLQARGILPEQLKMAVLVGISNPLISSFKKFTSVEEDIGALWIGPSQLVYWGDREQFAIKREELTEIERKADAGGTTMLAGVTHVILHVRQADGAERQIRLHTEGHWTMGAKSRAMDEIEERIVQWHSSTVLQPLLQQSASGVPPPTY